MKQFFTVRFYDADADVTFSAIFDKRWKAESYLASTGEDGYIE